MLGRNSWRQAQVCMTLARASDDPALKQYYEDLALKFAQKATDEHDPDPMAATPIDTDANKPGAIYPRFVSPRGKSR